MRVHRNHPHFQQRPHTDSPDQHAEALSPGSGRPASNFNCLQWLGAIQTSSVQLTAVSGGAYVARAAPSDPTLAEVLQGYFTENPELSECTKECYRNCIVHGFSQHVHRPVAVFTRPEILRLNRERLARLIALDPTNKPPRAFWGWQQELRTLRLLLRWHAAQTDQDEPWPDKRALRLHTPAARELPIELQSVDGRRKLIEGLSCLRTKSAKACQFILYSGLRRREGMALRRANLTGNVGITLQSKTRRLQLPLSSQALALIQADGHGRLLGVSEWQLRKPLLRIFGERVTARGRRACVTPHDLRRYFKTVGTELGIDPTVMNLLVGHSVQGVNKSYIANLRWSVLRAAAQRIGDEIENPRECSSEDTAPIPCFMVTPESNLHEATDVRSELTRAELREAIWSEPVRVAAQRMRMSDVGLAKICKRAGVPVPPRGYWSKVRAGQPVTRPDLPARPLGTLERIAIGGWACEQAATATTSADDCPASQLSGEEIEEMRQRAMEIVARARLAQSSKLTHPAIDQLIKRHSRRRRKAQRSAPLSTGDGALFRSGFEKRRLRILNLLFLILRQCGATATVRGPQARELDVKVGSVHVALTLDRASQRLGRHTSACLKFERRTDDRLRLEIAPWCNSSARLAYWEDNETTGLEKQVRQAAAEILMTAELIVRYEMKNQYELRMRRDTAAREETRRSIERLEQDRAMALLKDVEAWRRAADVRAYVRAVADACSAEFEGCPLEEAEHWTDWALREADRLDPLSPSIAAADFANASSREAP